MIIRMIIIKNKVQEYFYSTSIVINGPPDTGAYIIHGHICIGYVCVL